MDGTPIDLDKLRSIGYLGRDATPRPDGGLTPRPYSGTTSRP